MTPIRKTRDMQINQPSWNQRQAAEHYADTFNRRAVNIQPVAGLESAVTFMLDGGVSTYLVEWVDGDGYIVGRVETTGLFA